MGSFFRMRCKQKGRGSEEVPESQETSPENWAAILDELKAVEGIRTDAELASSLGVTRGFICSVRKGRKGLSLKLAEGVLDRLGRTLNSAEIERFVSTKTAKSSFTDASSLRRRVLILAGGHCQLCGNFAPFVDKCGMPYLEIHHITPPHTGGKDDSSYVVALCPNCHRKMQLAPMESDIHKLRKIAEQNR